MFCMLMTSPAIIVLLIFVMEAIIVVSAAVAAESEPETRPDDRGARASRIIGRGSEMMTVLRTWPPAVALVTGIGTSRRLAANANSVVLAAGTRLELVPQPVLEEPPARPRRRRGEGGHYQDCDRHTY